MTLYTAALTVASLATLGVIALNVYVCAQLILKTKETER